jgi:hypothetical protein
VFKKTAPITNNQDLVTSVKIEEESIKSWELKGEAYDAWSLIEQDWIEKALDPALIKYKIKINCGDCSKVIFKVKLKINESGKLDSYEKIELNVCGKDTPRGLEEDFINYFKAISFDESLKGLVVEAYLGRVLKC